MTTVNQLAHILQTLLTEDADHVADEVGLIQRTRLFTGASFAQTLVLGWLDNPQATLDDLAATAATCGAPVTSQALDQRFTATAAAFFQELLAHAVRRVVRAHAPAVPLLRRFTGVEVQDSSTITLPAALRPLWPGCGGSTQDDGAAAMRLQVRWNVTTGQLTGPYPQAGRLPDQAAPLQDDALPPGTLRLADLGYFDLDVFARYDRTGVWWLSRLLPKTSVYAVSGQPVDLVRWLARQGQTTLDVPIHLGAKHRLPCRLLAVRVPRAVVRQRRARIRQDARRRSVPVSAEKLALAGWTLLVTNVPPALLTLTEAQVLMRLRWQIELLFKLWKEQGQVDASRSHKPWRMLCEVYAKLLGLVVQHWIVLLSQGPRLDRSLRKAARKVRRHALHLASVLGSVRQVARVVRLIQQGLSKCSRITKSRKKPRTFQILETPALVGALT
jgi:DDE family transposase